MTGWLVAALRSGAQAGINAGAVVGLVAGLGGSLLTSSLPALAAMAGNIFLFLLGLLPLVFYLSLLSNPILASQAQVRALIAWLPAFLLSVVVFMMPVVLVPLVFGKGVTFEMNIGYSPET